MTSSIGSRRSSTGAMSVMRASRYTSNAIGGTSGVPAESFRFRRPTAMRWPSGRLIAGWINSSCRSTACGSASSSAQCGRRFPVSMSSSTEAESSLIEAPMSPIGGSPDRFGSTPAALTMIGVPGLNPSLRFHSVTSRGLPATLGITPDGRATRRPEIARSSATVNRFDGNGRRHEVVSNASQSGAAASCEPRPTARGPSRGVGDGSTAGLAVEVGAGADAASSLVQEASRPAPTITASEMTSAARAGRTRCFFPAGTHPPGRQSRTNVTAA